MNLGHDEICQLVLTCPLDSSGFGLGVPKILRIFGSSEIETYQVTLGIALPTIHTGTWIKL